MATALALIRVPCKEITSKVSILSETRGQQQGIRHFSAIRQMLYIFWALSTPESSLLSLCVHENHEQNSDTNSIYAKSLKHTFLIKSCFLQPLICHLPFFFGSLCHVRIIISFITYYSHTEEYHRR